MTANNTDHIIQEDLQEIECIVTEEDKTKFKRLDLFLVEKLPDYSRSFIKHLFEQGQIEVKNDQFPVKLELKRLPPVNSVLTILIPPPPPSDAEPQNIPLDVLYEDEHLIIINKPAGLVVHPGAGNHSGTLVNAILYHCISIQGVGQRFRPGIVHRLDKGTSGIMVVAKTQQMHEALALLFAKHDIKRTYQAIIMSKGGVQNIPPAGKIETLIGRHVSNRLKMSSQVNNGRKAITHYKILKQFDHCAHVECRLETGRTHQIRVHMSEWLKTPIFNDPLYGNPAEHIRRIGLKNKELEEKIKLYPHPFLHAQSLGFLHPISGKELFFEVAPPPIFAEMLENLNA